MKVKSMRKEVDKADLIIVILVLVFLASLVLIDHLSEPIIVVTILIITITVIIIRIIVYYYRYRTNKEE